MQTQQFEDFTDADWHAYAGCNTRNPKIVRHEWGEVVLDGKGICAQVINANGSGLVWAADFPTEAAARLIATTISCANDLMLYLGEAVGEL